MAKARCEEGDFDAPLNPDRYFGGRVGYPIFRVDYSSDEKFELYKTCWELFIEANFYLPEAIDPDDVMWYWVDNKAKLDGKGPRKVRELFQSLCNTSTFPYGSNCLWLCLMIDRVAIESMLRVYGPPATEIFKLTGPSDLQRREIPFLPYFTPVSTFWDEEDSNEEGSEDESESIESGSEDTCSEARGSEGIDDEVQAPIIDNREYHGHFKCALRCIFQLWQKEQVRSPDQYYPRDGGIWDEFCVYEPPDLL